MKGISKQQEVLSVISKCLKDYDKNLRAKKIMFIIEDKNRNIKKEEVYFPKSSFYHLTGVTVMDKKEKELNSYDFYDNIRDGKITPNKYIIKNKDKTTDLKLQVLPQLMRIDKMANMLGDFNSYSMFLQTEKLAGNTNACIGFIKDAKLDTYIPNTALKKDIRDITNERNKIIAILKKEVTQNLYANITYLKQNYQIKDILKNQEITKNIDIDNIYSADRIVDKKIYEYYYELENNNNERNIEDVDITDNF